ncbi:MAG: 4-(cytidine 5'-diphospho)-2-C-methyl-D-erythritol kinase [Bauldia sp.]|nr:4-(cytidine 5'-diphospho)-2-C-methyl-D-erythritol kinase [Bauldia sp.]
MAATTADAVSSVIPGTVSEIETARAKINLALHVLGRRDDGYHLLDSLVVFAEAGDTLTASDGGAGETGFTIDGPFAAALDATTTPGNNLVLAVANGLRAAFPEACEAGIRLDLEKRLPVAAGLGGGSADAAAALRLLNRHWQLGLSAEELAEMGLVLGADVPVCLASQPSRMSGIGETVVPVSGIPPMWMTLVNPGVSVATGNVFRRLEAAERSGLPPLPEPIGPLIEFIFWLRNTRNDLFAPAAEEAPLVETAVRALASDRDCAFARMSGSGATAFGIFMSQEAANRAAARIQKAEPDWWVAVTRTGGS